MEPRIPKQKPSKTLVAAISLSVVVHLALFVALQFQPRREPYVKVTYDYVTSAVWEVFGPTPIIRILEVHWPTSRSEEERPPCTDVETTLGEGFHCGLK